MKKHVDHCRDLDAGVLQVRSGRDGKQPSPHPTPRPRLLLPEQARTVIVRVPANHTGVIRVSLEHRWNISLDRPGQIGTIGCPQASIQPAPT